MLQHARDQSLTELRQFVPLAFPRGHGAAESLGFIGREPRRDDRQLHRLLLKDGHAERFLEDFADLVIGILNRLLSRTATADTDAPSSPESAPGRTIATSITRS